MRTERIKTLAIIALTALLGYMAVTGFAPAREVKLVVMPQDLEMSNSRISASKELNTLLEDGWTVSLVLTATLKPSFGGMPVDTIYLTK